MSYETQEAVIKLFNDNSSIASEPEYKAIYRKWIPSILARVAEVSNCKAFDATSLKILTAKLNAYKITNNSFANKSR